MGEKSKAIGRYKYVVLVNQFLGVIIWTGFNLRPKQKIFNKELGINILKSYQNNRKSNIKLRGKYFDV